MVVVTIFTPDGARGLKEVGAVDWTIDGRARPCPHWEETSRSGLGGCWCLSAATYVISKSRWPWWNVNGGEQSEGNSVVIWVLGTVSVTASRFDEDRRELNGRR